MSNILQIDGTTLFLVVYAITTPMMVMFVHIIILNFMKRPVAFYWTLLAFVPIIGPLLYLLMKPWHHKKERKHSFFFEKDNL